MVNGDLAVEGARQSCGGVAILHAQLAAGAIAIGVDGGLRHAQLARNLLGRQLLIDQAQAYTLARREQAYRIFGDDVTCSHKANSKR